MGDSNDMLTVIEMRVLATSVLHMNVEQIALSIITIPKLTYAIQRLLTIKSQPKVNKKGPPFKTTAKHFPVKRYQPVNGMRLRGYVIKPSTGTDYVDGADSDTATNAADSNLDGGYYPAIEEALHTSQPVFPDATPEEPEATVVSEEAEPTNKLTSDISLEDIIPETLSSGIKPEVNIIGNKLAIGKPRKSKSKSNRRVNYITCRICQTIFYNRDLYYDHIKTHAGEANVYTCRHCLFVTKRRQVYNTHILRHSGALPFKCKICKYAARQQGLLRHHIKNHHPEVDMDDAVVTCIPPSDKPDPAETGELNGEADQLKQESVEEPMQTTITKSEILEEDYGL